MEKPRQVVYKRRELNQTKTRQVFSLFIHDSIQIVYI